MFLIIGLTIGAFIGYKINDFVRKLNNGMEFKVCGLTVSINKQEEKEETVVDIKDKKTQKPSPVPQNKNKGQCEVCEGENMYIAGTKNLIPCPECGRNKEKFKTKTG